MQENRREFLKKSGRALSMTALATQMSHFGIMNAMAQTKITSEEDQNEKTNTAPDTEYRALVCLFLSGGNDSNNTIIPNYEEGYNEYAAARAQQGLAIPRASLLPITPPSMGGQVYGLHPAMTELHGLWNQGKMAVVSNVGSLVQPLTRATFQSGAPRPVQLYSHSDQTQQFQTAISSYRATSGWGGRVANHTGALNTGGLISMITSISNTSIFGNGNSSPLIVSPAPTPLDQLMNLKGFYGFNEDNARLAAMRNILTRGSNHTMTQSARNLTLQSFSLRDQLSQNPTLSASFPNTPLGNQLAQVARLIKFRTHLNMSRQIFFVQLGSFDTHGSQIAGQQILLREMSQALKTFYDETVAQGIGSQVTTFTMSDFNRTLNPAGTGSGAGSDHAWGGHHFVLGGAVAGGDFYGRPTSNGTYFPTLVNDGPDDADIGTGARGRFIPSVSVEQYAATLARWYGLADAQVPSVFPNIGNFPTSNLGFLS